MLEYHPANVNVWSVRAFYFFAAAKVMFLTPLVCQLAALLKNPSMNFR